MFAKNNSSVKNTSGRKKEFYIRVPLDSKNEALFNERSQGVDIVLTNLVERYVPPQHPKRAQMLEYTKNACLLGNSFDTEFSTTLFDCIYDAALKEKEAKNAQSSKGVKIA